MKNREIHFIVGNISVKGGVERATEILAEEFTKLGGKVHIHSIYSNNAASGSPGGIQTTHYGLCPPDLEPCLLKKILKAFRNGLRLRNRMRISGGTIVYQGFYVAIYLPFIKGGGFDRIVCEHSALGAVSSASAFARLLLYRLFQPTVVVLSEADKLFFQRKSIERVKKIYNPSPNIASKNPECHSKVLFSLGRFSPEKRFELMIQLCAPVLKRYPSWQLKIQGDGEDFARIETAIKDLDLENQVKLIPKGNPEHLYREGSILLLTSLFEGLPMVVLESLAAGIPILAFECSPGLAEAVRNEYNGYLVKMDDFDAFTQKLELLITDEGHRAALAVNARQTAEKFSIKLVIEEWKKIIQ